MHLAPRLNRMPPYFFARVAERIRAVEAQGHRVINLGIGSPDLPPPDFIIEAMIAAAREPASHRYPSYTGSPELREAIAGYYARRFGVALDPNREVLPLIGSKEGLAHVLMALVGDGDLVLVPDPGYPTYRMGTYLADGVFETVPLRPELGFLPDLDAIPEETYRRAVAFWVNYPNNPTGATAPREFYARLVDLAHRYNFVVLSDNPYADITFDGYRAPSFLETPGAKEVGVEFNSLSKTYNMAGWRVGMAVGNAEVIAALLRVKSNVDTGIFYPLQAGAIAALTGPQEWLAERNDIYRRRRDVVVEGLRAAGFQADPPKASLYVWARIPEGWTSEALSTHVLETAHIWLTPGIAFGEHGEGYVRVALTTDAETLAHAMEHVAQVLS